MSEDVMRAVQEKRSLDQLAPAFVRAWGEIQNVKKDASNPHFGNDYASLEAVINASKPILSRHGLALLQAPAGMDGDKIGVVSMLLHESGQHITVTTQLPIGGKVTAQAAGSGYSYARRYAWAAIFGMAQTDDDGNGASVAPPAKEKPRKPVLDQHADDSLLDTIARAKSIADLDAIKEAVRSSGEEAVANAYLARRKELRGK